MTCRIKGFIQPFERKLALQELRALANGPVTPVDGDEDTASIFSIAPTSDVRGLRAELAYWHSVGDCADGLTTQLRSEATLNVARAKAQVGQSPENVCALVPLYLPNRRSLRYATHGLHEYRGKFFPQLVRALMNISRLPKNAVVLDPMCGSGTTLVEAQLSERRGYGLDMNPLSVFITDVKCQALTLAPSELTAAYKTVQQVLSTRVLPRGEPRHFTSLAEGDQAYLRRWFSPQTIVELDHIEAAVRILPTETLQNFFRVAMSNILRKVSWQKNDDLRVRREEKEIEAGETTAIFLEEAKRSTHAVAAYLTERGAAQMGNHMVREADARQAVQVFPDLSGNVDAVITSPPYATALPYIDTDRLSLIFLGLLPRERHNTRDVLMIGNREVTPRGRKEYWASYEKNRRLLPESTQALIERIDQLNKEEPTGFRRRNLSALLSKYFFDMREVMQQAFTLLRSGGAMFLVVGSNRTTAGGHTVEIPTPYLLRDIASSLGFQALGDISMEMLVSRNIFKKNAVPSENILMLQRPQ